MHFVQARKLLALVALSITAQASAQQIMAPAEINQLPKTVSQAAFTTPFTGRLDPTVPVGIDKGYDTLKRLEDRPEIKMRGTGQRIYKASAPAVVLISTNDGIGSGAIIDRKGTVLTNWHVVQGNSTVGVFLKPPKFQNVQKENMLLADVVKIDEVADLAIIKLRRPPANVTPFEFGSIDDVDIAIEVHAIGHPLGEAWTYTQGIVSQIRPDYEWRVSEDETHRGDVIQTQTPINPGNSGGPLIADSGKLIGINSFVNSNAQGLNYAVAITEIDKFLKSSEDRLLAPPAVPAGPDLSKLINHPTAVAVDLNNDGQADGVKVDYNNNGFYDALLVDSDGDGGVDEIYVDRNENGNADLMIRIQQVDGQAAFVWLYDQNENGQADILAYDLNRDGVIDRVERA